VGRHREANVYKGLVSQLTCVGLLAYGTCRDSTGGLPAAALAPQPDPSTFHNAIRVGYVESSDDDMTDAGDHEDDADNDADVVEEAVPEDDGAEADGVDDGPGEDAGTGYEAADDAGEDGGDDDAEGSVEETESDDDGSGSELGSGEDRDELEGGD
jgi:hypothetical protein